MAATAGISRGGADTPSLVAPDARKFADRRGLRDCLWLYVDRADQQPCDFRSLSFACCGLGGATAGGTYCVATLACHWCGLGGGADHPAAGIRCVFIGILAAFGSRHDVCDI